MAIDKESTGRPEMNVRRRTTKVNLWMIAGILVFFVAMAVVVLMLARSTPGGNRPSTSTQQETQGGRADPARPPEKK